MSSKTARIAGFGFLLGFCLSRIGFSDFGEVHAMFVFADLRLFLTFCVAVAAALVGFFTLVRSRTPKLLHPGVVPGSILFGIGWAIAGACPAIALVQLGEGQLMAAFTLAGMFVGNFVYGRVHGRLFRWNSGSCEL